MKTKYWILHSKASVFNASCTNSAVKKKVCRGVLGHHDCSQSFWLLMSCLGKFASKCMITFWLISVSRVLFANMTQIWKIDLLGKPIHNVWLNMPRSLVRKRTLSHSEHYLHSVVWWFQLLGIWCVVSSVVTAITLLTGVMFLTLLLIFLSRMCPSWQDMAICQRATQAET